MTHDDSTPDDEPNETDELTTADEQTTAEEPTTADQRNEADHPTTADEPNRSDDPTTADEETAENEQQDSAPDPEGVGLDRRSFMQAGAASLAGLGGLASMSGRAEAQSSSKHIIVVARDAGRHTYEIEVRGGSIQKSDYAGGNDTIVNPSGGGERVEGTVYNWNADSYRYTGEIHRVTGDGNVSFHFPDGGFTHDDRIVVAGEGDGYCHYSLGTSDGDIDPIEDTTNEDQEDDDTSDESEHYWTPDLVEGRVWDVGVDTFRVRAGNALQTVHIEDGHATFSAYQTGRSGMSGSDGEACIVYFYMGDGPYTTFFQNFMNLTEALRGYDRTILLKHDNQSNPIGAVTHRLADTVREPTRENFERSVRELAEDEFTIDMYITSHGDRSSFKMSTGSHGSEDWYDYADIQRFRSEFVGEMPLRMVYQCNCWGSNLNDAWVELGADAAAGPRYVNFFPNQLPNFAREWRQGHSFHEALTRANTRSSRLAVRTVLSGDVAATKGSSWGPLSCHSYVVFNNNGSCAKNYFTKRWGHSDAEWYSTSDDGWGFAVYASDKIAEGDLTISR